MDRIVIRTIKDETAAVELLKYYSPYLESLRTGRVEVLTIAKKLVKYGTIIELNEGGQHIGFAGFYHNDIKDKVAYLSLIAISKYFEGQGYGSFLLRHVEEMCEKSGMQIMNLEVNKKNLRALKFYKKNGYLESCSISIHSIILFKKINCGGKNE